MTRQPSIYEMLESKRRQHLALGRELLAVTVRDEDWHELARELSERGFLPYSSAGPERIAFGLPVWRGKRSEFVLRGGLSFKEAQRVHSSRARHPSMTPTTPQQIEASARTVF